VLVHERVLHRSRILFSIFNNNSEAAASNVAVLPNIGLREFKIIMLAIYGIRCPILGVQEYAAVDYVKALTLANTYQCRPEVYDSIADCTQGYFWNFTNWKSIPDVGITMSMHFNKIMEINEAYKAYKTHAFAGGSPAFFKSSFAILLWVHCPASVYVTYCDRLDADLVREVSIAAMTKRDYAIPFSNDEIKLFSKPNF
jgi:hypothetical protein